MAAVKIAEGIYWVGAVDWTVRNFHGYVTPTGTTYNAYLVVDDRTALIDTVKGPFCGELLENVRQVVDPSKIDYVISNHAETDHSGSLPKVMQAASRAELVCVRMGQTNLSRVFPNDAGGWKFRIVKEGDSLKLGRRTLQFVETPMLHWPESMFTYSESDGILFSMDAFGQHNATAERFDDELPLDIVTKEAAKYYANIIMPYSRITLSVLEKLKGKKIGTLATSHGAIWRKNAAKIVELYGKWARGEAEEARGVVVYDSMWGSTENMARSIVEGFEREGVPCSLIHLSKTDDSEAVLAVMESKAVVVGSPTLNNTIFPPVARFLEYLKGLKPPGKKIGAVFGSYGWGGGASKYAKEALKSAGLEVAEESLDVRFAPTEEELKRCVEFGAGLARKIET